MTCTDAQKYLQSFINHEIHLDQIKSTSFKIERVQKLLSGLRCPQNNFKIIHIAGSKGKGSVSALVANILQKSGYKCGLYTSPHINSYRERIRILKSTHFSSNPEDIFPDMISEEQLCAILEEIKPTIEKLVFEQEWDHISFFEIFTVLALYYFSQQSIDVAVLETGLGGRLDATNAVNSQIAVITPISLEHTHILGNDIIQIAREKAAIIKDDQQKVVIAPQQKKVRDIFKKRCDQFAIDPLWIEEYTQCELIEQSINEQVFDLKTGRVHYTRLSMPLLGKHQRDNCAVSVGVIESLEDMGLQISKEAVKNGIKSVFWPGRFEVIKDEPLTILDGAHNEASVEALIDLMVELFEPPGSIFTRGAHPEERSDEGSPEILQPFRLQDDQSGTTAKNTPTGQLFKDKKIILICGISRDKNVKSICDKFAKITDHIIFVKANHPRAKNLPGSLSVRKALEWVDQKCTKDDIILITGSIFVVSEARAIIQSSKVSTV